MTILYPMRCTGTASVLISICYGLTCLAVQFLDDSVLFLDRFVQEVSVGPLRIILLSYDQLKILHLERKRYDEQTTPKPPFFVVGTDATGKLCAEMKDLKSEKRIFNYTFVKDVAIPGSSENPMIFTFGDMITNDNSWLGISVFYQKLKAMFIEEHKYWPPFQGIVTDFCWAQIRAIVALSFDFSIDAHFRIIYRYVRENDADVNNFVRSSFVQVFLCIAHLSRTFLKDVDATLPDAKDQSIAKTFFVTFCHTTDYDELLETLKLMCRFFLVDEEPVRLEILKKLGHRDFEQPTNRENLDDYTDEECIYKSSPFYQDGFKIYQKELKKSFRRSHHQPITTNDPQQDKYNAGNAEKRTTESSTVKTITILCNCDE
ncbi:uncharacterized protein LOC119769475 [Culex quinquefasciatus]|uniref:uncharacterized protein LOC119769475 n=1 Tax=Culex quinquefasciatus TaxID=7176 RepID=UPI0018E34AE7|nr:uncharacterized protein LOC119769475 [Culex quinquefasciatus]